VNRNAALRLTLGALCVALIPSAPALAADDEIMVTDGDLATVGKPELEVHTNFSRGSAQSPGDRVFAPNNVLRLTPELSIGLSEHWDAGLYLPTSWVPGHGLYYDGIKARAKTIYTHAQAADVTLFYGLQFELADVNPGVSSDRTSVEVKAIAGAGFGDWVAAMNVVEQRDVPDRDLISPGYAFNVKLVRALGSEVEIGAEHYRTWSSTNFEAPVREIDDLTFLTVQWKARSWDLHLGVGHGWRGSPDTNVVKLVIGIPIE
jgi:hypothetical protein